MSADFLNKIVAHKKDLLKEKKAFYESLRKKVAQEKLSRYGIFKKAISKKGAINLIAEIKKASPSQGVIRQDFDVLKIANIYVKNGAAAISVLTEDKFFLGKPMYVKNVSEHFNVPVLTKDFIIDEVQIFEALMCGASAVLLIAAILTDEQIEHLIKTASDLDMDCLVEVHDEKELSRALKAGAEIVGINNRDLHTFTIDLQVSEKLMPLIPKDKIIVVESGIQSRMEVEHFESLRAHAVLIGETFMRSSDIASKIKEIMHGLGAS